MSVFIIPHSVGTNRANLWLGVRSKTPPDDLQIDIRSGTKHFNKLVRSVDWEQSNSNGLLNDLSNKFYFQIITIEDLNQNTKYNVNTNDGTAEFRTLPSSLPPLGKRSFNILLSSCFYYNNDKTGKAGKTFKKISNRFKPDIKIMCGDQVYLDVADGHFMQLNLIRNEDPKYISRSYLKKYINTWTQRNGYNDILRIGATYFTADDHEFWNNFPNPTPLILNTYKQNFRDSLKQISLSFYNDFQSDDINISGHPRIIDMGNISFFIADTRIFREEGDSRFMSDEDFESLISWIEKLNKPGVLAIGQPLLQSPSGFVMKNVGDRAMSNYRQYRQLVKTLFCLRHSLVVLSGDVHFGRIASCILNFRSIPVELVEIVSSPISLVSDIVGGKAEDAPYSFPPEPVIGVAGVRCKTHYKTSRNNFATIHLNELNGQVRLQVRYWFPDGAENNGASVFTKILR